MESPGFIRGEDVNCVGSRPFCCGHRSGSRGNAVYIETMSEVKITALEDGPLEVDGLCAVLASDVTVVKEGAKVFLCLCGHSANKPMCDGSHKSEGFTAS